MLKNYELTSHLSAVKHYGVVYISPYGLVEAMSMSNGQGNGKAYNVQGIGSHPVKAIVEAENIDEAQRYLELCAAKDGVKFSGFIIARV